MKRVISVYLPTWPTDRLRAKDNTPERNVPFATVMRDGTRRVLASVDGNAAKLKLYAGQTLAYAQAMVPGIILADADVMADYEALKYIGLAFLKLYSPIVALSEPTTIWLDVTGCAHLWGGEEDLIDDLLEQLHRKQVFATAAIADTVGAAYALARYSKRSNYIVPVGETQAALAKLPVKALRVSDTISDALNRLGFHRIEQLYKTPRAPLVKRFGKELMLRLDQALGNAPEPIEPLSTPEIPEVKCFFPEPAANPDFIAKAVEELSSRLCQQLESKGVGARRLDLIYHRVDNTVQAIRIGTVSASRQPKHQMRLFAEHFDKIDYGFGIEALTLRAPLVETLKPKQFTNALGGIQQADLSGLVDILHNRLGSKRVYQTAAIESDVPERSICKRPALTVKFANWPKSLPRPARLLQRPEQIVVIALLPDHPPRQFIWRGKPYKVTRADGPERIFGEWWKDSAEVMAVRDYFQVEVEAGGRFWLFRYGDGVDTRTGSQDWFVQGFFG